MFDGGLRQRAGTHRPVPPIEGSVASYRQTVLAGFQQVEDQIVTLRVLEQAGVIEDETVKAARKPKR
jgi:outer membrane protein TolC